MLLLFLSIRFASACFFVYILLLVRWKIFFEKHSFHFLNSWRAPNGLMFSNFFCGSRIVQSILYILVQNRTHCYLKWSSVLISNISSTPLVII
jgi:hypothetical protein